MRLRPADEADAPALARVHAAAFETPWGAVELAALLATAGVFALAAETETRQIAGFILIRIAADEAEVLTLAVDPSARRRGVGRGLVEAAAGIAARHATSLFLEVAADNAAAQALYGAAGFSAVGRRPAYYAQAAGAVDALVLRRTLNT